MEWIPVTKMFPDDVEFPATYDGVIVSVEGYVYMTYRWGDWLIYVGLGQ